MYDGIDRLSAAPSLGLVPPLSGPSALNSASCLVSR